MRYELAGIGSRFLALVLDLAIQSLVALGAYVVVALASAPVLALAGGALSKFWVAFALSSLAVLTFALFFGYFIGFELLWNGQTPGKRALGIRVVRDGGFPVDIGASVLRNIIRVIEASLGFYVISAIVMLVSPENKRAGDYAAGTIVVRDSADAVPTLALLAREGGEGDDGLDHSDRALIDAFLARRKGLEPAAATEIAARIAQRVRPKLRASFHYLDDVALLEHLARSRG